MVHVQTLDYCRFPAETTHRQLTHSDPYQRRAEVNDTVRRGLKYFVEDLVTVVTNDPNVLVASRAVSAIEHFTGETFGELPPFTDAVKWWQEEGQTNSVYLSPFGEIATGNYLFNQRRFDDAITVYENCVSNRSGLAITYFNLFNAYWLVGNREKATNSLLAAISEAQAPPDAHLEYASILASDGEQNKAIKILAEAKPFIKGFATMIKADARFQSLGTNSQFKALIETDEE